MSGSHTIYKLVDPRDGSVFYVGKTKNIGKRLWQHYLNKNNVAMRSIFDSIISCGRFPKIVKISECAASCSSLMEAYYISTYSGRGHNLINKVSRFYPGFLRKNKITADKIRISNCNNITEYFRINQKPNANEQEF